MFKILLVLTLAIFAKSPYDALVTKVYDGDTYTCTIDLGLNVKLYNQKIRLMGIDTPELRGEERPEGLKARDFARSYLMNKNIVLDVHGKGKYGRWVATVYFIPEIGMIESVLDSTPMVDMNKMLVDSGYAVYRGY